MIDGGTSPSTGTNARDMYMEFVSNASYANGLVMIFVLTRKGNDASPQALEEIVRTGLTD